MAIQATQSKVAPESTESPGVDPTHEELAALAYLFKNWFVDAHLAETRSPGDPSGASDVGASLSYRSNWLDGIVERRKIGPNFNPESGFH